MPKRLHKRPSMQRRLVHKIIFAVAILQPLGTIPQVIAIFSSHNASSISISSWFIYVAFDLVWLWYGLDEHDWAITASAILFTLFEAAVLIGAFTYGGTW